MIIVPPFTNGFVTVTNSTRVTSYGAPRPYSHRRCFGPLGKRRAAAPWLICAPRMPAGVFSRCRRLEREGIWRGLVQFLPLLGRHTAVHQEGMRPP